MATPRELTRIEHVDRFRAAHGRDPDKEHCERLGLIVNEALKNFLPEDVPEFMEKRKKFAEMKEKCRRALFEKDEAEAENLLLRLQTHCCICGEAQKEKLFVPCAHFIACGACANNLKYCVACSAKIHFHVNVYM